MPKKGYKQTTEAKRNTMLAGIEYHKTHPEVAKEVGLMFTEYWASEKGQAQKAVHSKLMTGIKRLPRSEEWSRKISESKKGSIPWNKGIPHSEEAKTNMSGSRPSVTGKNHPNWKGGITPFNHLIRNGLAYAGWRKAVFERDDYTCQDCGDDRGGNLNAHHIKSFIDYPELRFEVDNGETLCEDCHTKEHLRLENCNREMRV